MIQSLNENSLIQPFHIAMTRQHFEDFEKNAVSNFEEIEKNRIKDFEETGLDLRFSLFSRGQEDFSLGLDHWMAQVRIFRGDVRHPNMINS